MFFKISKNKESEPDSSEEQYTDYSTVRDVSSDNYEVSTYSNIDQKKYAFYAAIQKRGLPNILGEITTWFSKQIELKDAATEMRLKYTEGQIDELKIKLTEEKQKLEHVEVMVDEVVDEKLKCEERIVELKNNFEELISDLGKAHKNLLSDRLKEVKTELNDLVNLYTDIFENKYQKEDDLKEAVQKHIGFCDQLIDNSKINLNILKEKLEKIYLFGDSKVSASLLVYIGVVSAIASGWFFAIFSENAGFENQNWLFFTLSSIFNYLGIYVEQYGFFEAVRNMLAYFTVLLLGITVFIYGIELFLYKVSSDQPYLQMGISSIQKSKKSLKINIKSNSFLSFWLQILPWILIAGVLFIFIVTGQLAGDNDDQIIYLGKLLSGQIIGSVITLLFAGAVLVYVSKVVEPKKLQQLKSEENQTGETRKKWMSEVSKLVLGVNLVLLVVIISQFFNSGPPNRSTYLSILFFILLVNLTAFTLSYGIQQKGIIKSSEQTEKKIFYLIKLRKALSGTKPIHLWIREERQFEEHFLSIQKDLFELVKIKNKSLNQYKKPRSFSSINPFKTIDSETDYSKIGKLNLSRKKETQFYMRNFPELTYQIDELRNSLNSEKRTLEDLKSKLTELRDGHSDFQNEIKEELRRLSRNHSFLLRDLIHIQDEKVKYYRTLNEEKRGLELALIEGYELGEWASKKVID